MPIRRRSGLHAMWLHRVDGNGRCGPSSDCRTSHCRTPVYGIGSRRKTLDGFSKEALTQAFRKRNTFSVQYPCARSLKNKETLAGGARVCIEPLTVKGSKDGFARHDLDGR